MNSKQKIICKTARIMAKGFPDCNYKTAKEALLAASKYQTFGELKLFCFHMRTAAKSTLKAKLSIQDRARTLKKAMIKAGVTSE